MIDLLIVILFGLAFAVKGEHQEQWFTNYNRVRGKNWVIDRLLDGKILSFLIVSAVILFSTGYDYVEAFIFGTAWLIAVSPSMGEEMGIFYGGKVAPDGVGKHGWSPYQKWMPDVTQLMSFDVREGTIYGFKKGVQRGVFGGAAMMVATGEAAFVWFSLTYMFVNWLSARVGQKFSFNGWPLSEYIFGAVGFGIPTVMWLNGGLLIWPN